MEAIQRQDSSYDIFTSSLYNVEIADNATRAILTIPLMHVGANKKGLYWTAKMLKKIGTLFRSVPYRYDLNGQEGSSHTINKLSSPHFDVGWTYSSEEGSWYDEKTKALWTKGEVTHPDVIAKLGRVTTDGKREVNYASMGVIVEKAICSICGSEMNGNTCEDGHTRLETYGNKLCYKVPTEVSKALHVALTNDPADGEAEIKNVIIQEMGGNMEDNKFPKKDKESDSGEDNFQKKGSDNTKDDDSNVSPAEQRPQAGNQMDKSQLDNQIPGGLAPSSPQTAQPGMAPSPETILRDMAERIKTIENKLSLSAMQAPTPELVNAAPQDQFVQDNMGTTTQFGAQENEEASTMDVKGGQNSNAAAPLNPEKKEMQDAMGGDPMSQIMGMLQQILTRLPGAEVQDMGKEAQSANKGQAKQAQADIPTEHQGPGDAVGSSEDEGNAKNKANMNNPGAVATADASGETEKLKTEVADLTGKYKSLIKKLELQDNNIPEFGGAKPAGAEVADMMALGQASRRATELGDYGKWSACFEGADAAQRFVRD